MPEAKITNIQHFNVHDGPGIRTVVFFQGCSLQCRWCQNPETISTRVRVMYNPDLCIGCGACVTACPVQAICVKDGVPHADADKCTLCGACAEECYAGASTLTSKTMTLDEVYHEVMKDETVYRNSGGGVTVSGGEPLLHVEFNRELLQRVKSAGVTTAVETAGNVPQNYLDRVREYVDTFLFDFKLNDGERHKYWVGADNSQIKSNLRYICSVHPNVVVRIPLIPSVNDTDEEFTAMMEFVKDLKHINSVHILPFHNFGAGKYSLLGRNYELWDFPEENEERVQACREIAESYGFRVNLGGTGFADDKKRNG